VQWIWKLAREEALRTPHGAEGWAEAVQSLVARGTISVREAQAFARPIALSELVALSQDARVPLHARRLAAKRASEAGGGCLGGALPQGNVCCET